MDFVKATRLASSFADMEEFRHVPWILTPTADKDVAEYVVATYQAMASIRVAPLRLNKPVLVDVTRLAEAVSRLPGDVFVTEEQGSLRLRAGKMSVRWITHPAAEDAQPSWPQEKPEAIFSLEMMAKGIASVAGACANKRENRAALQGVHIAADGNSVTFTATDGKRAARAVWAANTSRPWQGLVQPGVILKAVEHLGRAAQQGLFYAHQDRVIVRAEDVKLSAMNIAENFPNMDSIFKDLKPLAFTTLAVADLAAAVKAALPFTHQELHRFTLEVEGQAIRLVASDNHGNSCTTVVPVHMAIDQHAMDVGGHYLAAAASAFAFADQISLSLCHLGTAPTLRLANFDGPFSLEMVIAGIMP